MCRKPHKTVSKDYVGWITGHYGPYGWAIYWCRRTSLRKMRWWRSESKGRFSIENILKRFEIMAQKPNVDEVLRQNGGLGPSHGEAGKLFPNLASWLCDAAYEDTTPKGRVKLEAERRGDRVRIQIRSADTGLMVEHFSENLGDAVLGLELLLGSKDCPWQLDPYPMDKPKTRGKKKS